MYVLQIVVCPFVLFLLAIVSSVLLKIEKHEPIKTRGELRCPGRVSKSCSTSDSRRVNLVTNPVISYEWGQDRELFTTSGTYLWLFVTQTGFLLARVSRSLALYVCFADRCLSFCTFSFGHCIVCSSSIYGFWLPPFGTFKLFLKQVKTFTIDHFFFKFILSYKCSK
jgi:hypothetical protein